MAALPSTVNNPFASQRIESQQSEALVAVEQSRAVAEIQAAMLTAKRFPRNAVEAMDRILNSCTRQTLAEAALYTYSRGGTEITGPSIRLAEALAQSWGNIKTSVRELEQRDGASTVQAIAWDLESGYQSEKVFQVKHWRDTKKGGYPVTDSRDIYEMTANQGSRRLRACILAVIPGDVIEAAVKQCEATLKTKAEVTPERIKSTIDKFAELGVTKEQIEKRLQRHIESMQPAQLVSLGKIYNSMRDGMSKAVDWFDPPEGGAAEAPKASGADKIKAAAEARNRSSAPKSQPAANDCPYPDEVAALTAVDNAKSRETADLVADACRGTPFFDRVVDAVAARFNDAGRE